jgi:hypothetical protein
MVEYWKVDFQRKFNIYRFYVNLDFPRSFNCLKQALFHHSSIPIFQFRSEAELSSKTGKPS